VSLREGTADSMFGFTVAQHVDHDQTWSVHCCLFGTVGPHQKLVIVHRPTPFFNFFQVNFFKSVKIALK